jgi:glycosyltransferase involved in cell wall biosynthesis
VKRLLFHSYFFPPIGGAGAQRPLAMARHLVEFGYHSVVITCDGATPDHWAPEDATLSGELPADLEVLRLPRASDPETSSPWRERGERWLRRPSPWQRWWIAESAKLGARAARDVDLVYCWMQPYDSAEAAALIAAGAQKPWVADLGDPWALDEMVVYPSGLHRRLELRRMGRVLDSAAAIVMSTPEAVRRLRHQLPGLAEKPVVAIPNGFDSTHFNSPVRPRADGKFRIVHTGYLHTRLGRQLRRSRRMQAFLGGSVSGLDILTRSHVYLIEAINLLLESDPSLHDILQLHLAGVLTADDQEVAARCPVAHLHGYVTHSQSIELIRTADLLFLPMQKLPEHVRATIVPGKTYEYLASGTPILAAVPDGDARDILEEAGGVSICPPDGVDEMAAALRTELDRFRRASGWPPRRSDVVDRFEYRRLAAALAEVFDSLTVA